MFDSGEIIPRFNRVADAGYKKVARRNNMPRKYVTRQLILTPHASTGNAEAFTDTQIVGKIYCVDISPSISSGTVNLFLSGNGLSGDNIIQLASGSAFGTGMVAKTSRILLYPRVQTITASGCYMVNSGINIQSGTENYPMFTIANHQLYARTGFASGTATVNVFIEEY